MSQINSFEVVDYLTEARGRVTEQFTNKIVFDKYLQLLISAQVEVQQVFKNLMQLRSVDTATGAQLDIIGNIVGQDRVLLNADFYTFFGFQGALKAGTFGDVNSPGVGSMFLNFGRDRKSVV